MATFAHASPLNTREADSMAERKEVALDRAQVKKAVQALQAFLKSKSTSEALFLEETQQISLLFTLWRIPKAAHTIRIPLPHGQRPDTDEVCLFTRDEPNMTSEQTKSFYKKLLEVKGVKGISEIIPYKVLKTEYKPYEAKRRLLGNFDMFLSDDRVRRLLPSHLGKHFYERKREPLCVNLQSKHLDRDVQRMIQGTILKVTNKGPCCMARVAHSGMTADEVTENVEAVVQTVMKKLRMKGPRVKIVHLKSQTSVALPIFTSNLSNLDKLQKREKRAETPDEEAKKLPEKKKRAATGEGEEAKDNDDDEIPQLVPIATPSKKAKQEKPNKKRQMKKVQRPAATKKGKKHNRQGKKKSESKVKRKVGKVK